GWDGGAPEVGWHGPEGAAERRRRHAADGAVLGFVRQLHRVRAREEPADVRVRRACLLDDGALALALLVPRRGGVREDAQEPRAAVRSGPVAAEEPPGAQHRL